MLLNIAIFVAGLFYGWLICYLKLVLDKQVEVESLKTENDKLRENVKEAKKKLIEFQVRLRGE